MGEILGDIFHAIFSDILKNSSKTFRYFIITICEVVLMFIFVFAFIKQDRIEWQIFIGVLILVFLVLYVYLMFKIRKAPKQKKLKKHN